MPLRRDLLLEYLHRIQDAHGCLPKAQLVALAARLGLAPVEVFEVASFYHHFEVLEDEDANRPQALTVRVCDSLSCAMAGADTLAAALEAQATSNVRIVRVPCVGRCDRAPAVVVGDCPIAPATADTVAAAVASAQHAPETLCAIGFDDYVAAGGYACLKRCHDDPLFRAQALDRVEQADLRGLGGAGFPAARKWRIVREQPAPRLMVVNLDEGEPGTFKDRVVLESDPHRMLEGMLIAALMAGCDAVYIYLRDEYPAIRALLIRELAALQTRLTLPLPTIELRRGAGAYVCGEESALIESLEGKRGMPRLRPPFVAERGLFGRPTLVNNGETLFWVRELAEGGAAAFRAAGENGRHGLRRFSVSGRVARPGVVLAPAGITLNRLIDEYCGGMAAGHVLQGYFPGGASGGILPARLADVPLDFDTLAEHGCFIGSAAIIVFSTQDDVRALALNAMRFFAHESCGKCTPCRVGTHKAAELMAQPVWDAALLGELAATMRDASICGLGQAAPNPMECALRYFPEAFADV
ncbi:MAG: NAD(P)H-dependent oxidoreductase subunit E [Rhodocyclaceae bacterium]|nr:NAD(P)H-dependent oxidoreductase subunit E [Rhodocyclaceae bacterium]